MEESRRRMSVTSSSAGLNNSVFGPPLSRSDVVMSDSVQMTSYTSSSAPTQISGIAGSSGDVDEAANLNQSIFYRSGMNYECFFGPRAKCHLCQFRRHDQWICFERIKTSRIKF